MLMKKVLPRFLKLQKGVKTRICQCMFSLNHYFQSLMQTRRLDYDIPSEQAVSREVEQAFIQARKHIAIMVQEYEGQLNFATDAWTSPNHKAFVAFTVHFAHEGTPVSMLLDLVEVAKLHSGVNLAAAFVKVLEDFGITDKVS